MIQRPTGLAECRLLPSAEDAAFALVDDADGTWLCHVVCDDHPQDDDENNSSWMLEHSPSTCYYQQSVLVSPTTTTTTQQQQPSLWCPTKGTARAARGVTDSNRRTTTSPSCQVTLLDTTVASPILTLVLDLLLVDNHHNSNQTLLGVCLKRQLVGCPLPLFQSNAAASIQIRVPLEQQLWTLSVQLCTAASEDAGVGQVLPSTRITIHTRKVTNNNGHYQNTPQHTDNNNNNAPSVQDFLVDTLHILTTTTPHVPCTVLLAGPPGVGKTFAVQRALERVPSCRLVASLRGSEVVGQAGSAVAAARVVARHFGAAEDTDDDRPEDYDDNDTTRNTNDDSNEKTKTPARLLFLDECDALTASPVVAAMLAHCLDRRAKKLLVVAATNRVDDLPATLRRRFDCEWRLAPPTAAERCAILQHLLPAEWQQHQDELRSLAQACVGYVAADLANLVRRATLLHLANDHDDDNQNLKQNDSPNVWDYLDAARRDVTASALRDAALSAPPPTQWDDIAGDAGGAKKALRQAIEWPRQKAAAFQRLGLSPPRGILLYGPPGCAKTTLARAAAGASGVAFVSLAPADVYASSYVGEAEAVVRRAFDLARSAAPCILFFDEMDAIVGAEERFAGGLARGHAAEARVLSTFLNEMDGIDQYSIHTKGDGVLVLGATNRPWTLDAALLRPGRLDKVIYVPAPDAAARRAILDDLLPPGMTMDTAALAHDDVSGHMTGAELKGAVQAAALQVLREHIDTKQSNDDDDDDVNSENDKDETVVLRPEHVWHALRQVQPLLADERELEPFRAFQRRTE